MGMQIRQWHGGFTVDFTSDEQRRAVMAKLKGKRNFKSDEQRRAVMARLRGKAVVATRLGGRLAPAHSAARLRASHPGKWVRLYRQMFLNFDTGDVEMRGGEGEWFSMPMGNMKGTQTFAEVKRTYGTPEGAAVRQKAAIAIFRGAVFEVKAQGKAAGKADGGSIRGDVAVILARHGLDNRFTVRTVGFSDLLRSDAQVVTIKDWKPSPLADAVKSDIRRGTGAIVMFEGDW